ncbi:hypothetical protein B0H21DRAFT_775099 [Amylocystis lapponica]|nr:hypothetical protein B0H21DRAFT_775099 [Amylocystis lapponica]
MAYLGSTLAVFLFAIQVLISPCQAQSRAFQWKFGNNFILTELEECQTLSIIVESITNNASELGVAPYNFVAFELEGVPTTTMVGSNLTELSWQVTHRAGSTLMLTMMDSNGSTGGIGPSFYNVTAGTNTSCLPAAPSASIAHITPNVTATLETCQPWGLTMTNGTKPYNVTFAALNSPVVTTVTMGPEDDVFTYIDRADPNGELIAVVSDTHGWGYSTGAVSTTGSSNTSCVGLISTSQTAAQIAAEQAAQAAAQAAGSKKHRRDIIIGVVVGVGVPLIFTCIAAAWWWRRRQMRDQGIWDGQDMRPRSWAVPPSSEPTGEVQSPKRALAFGHMKLGSINSSLPLLSEAPEQGGTRSQAGPSSQTVSHAGSSGDDSRRPRKGAQRQVPAESALSIPSESQQENLATTSSLLALSAHLMRSQSTNSLGAGASLDPQVEPDIIIQHRDGGVVQELPPPYLDRYTRSQDPPEAH